MSTGNLFYSDLPNIYNIVEMGMLSYPKELTIGMLREFFSKDSLYHYQKDEWGFPYTPDHTDLPYDAGLHDSATTRVYIGEKFRYDVPYYPAILVSSGGMRSTPISFNRENTSVQWKLIDVVDGYGNIKEFRTPSSFILAGAQEGSINIDILSRGIRERDDLCELAYMLFVDLMHAQMANSGVVVKSGSPSIGSPSETEDRNDKLYRQTITLEIRTEWRRNIPVTTVVDAINVGLQLIKYQNGNIQETAPNLRIDESFTLIQTLQNL